MKASSLSPRAGTVRRSFPRGWPEVVLWHRAIDADCGRRQGGLGWRNPPHSIPTNTETTGEAGLWGQLHGLEFGQPTGVKWHSSACPCSVCQAGGVYTSFTTDMRSFRGSCDWPSRAHNKGNWALLTYKIRAAAN